MASATDNPIKKSYDSTPKKSKDSSETQRKQQDLENQHAMSKASHQPQSETKAASKDQKVIKKIKISGPKKSNIGEPSSSGLGKEKEKTIPSLKLHIKPIIKEHSVHHIRWKGFEKTSNSYNCSLCEKDIAYLPNEEKWKNYIHEQNELEYSISSRVREEQGQCSILPEAAILPCSHVFHSMCLSETLMQHSDPPCPICLRL